MGARCSIARPSRRARPMPINSARFAELRQGRDTAEARFRAAEARVGDRNELRVRIFPDESAITAHRRELTGAELADAKAYWIERAKARTAPDPAEGEIAVRGAATLLASRYGSNRARWLARES